MDLPTYTNIWRIEKRLYKLYDFRLPAPLPITWIGVFAGITVPYVIFLIAVGLPFNHNLVWLYVLPPGVLTWLTTRPVIESKRLPELVSSQLRYVAEPRTWCRMAPFAEKDEILVTARVWHSQPPKARPKRVKRAPAKARSAIREPQLAAVEAEELAPAEVRPASAGRPVARPLAARQTAAPPPVAAPRRCPPPRCSSRRPNTTRRRCRNARRPAGLSSAPRPSLLPRPSLPRPSLKPSPRPSRWYGRRGLPGRTGRNQTPRAARPPARCPRRISPRRGPPRRRPGCRTPGRSRSHTTPTPASAAWTKRRPPSARHPGPLPRSTCSRWSVRARSPPRSPRQARSRKPARSLRSARSPSRSPLPARIRQPARIPHPAPSARPAPTPAPRRAPGPGPACRSGTCPA